MLESCAFIGTKAKQISYLIMTRHATLASAFIFPKALLLPLVPYLAQVFAQVHGLLLWLLLIEELQKCSWQSSEKHIRYPWTLLTVFHITTPQVQDAIWLICTSQKNKTCAPIFLNRCFLIIFLWQDPNINRVLRHCCYRLFFEA